MVTEDTYNFHFPKYVLVHIRIKGEVGAVKLV